MRPLDWAIVGMDAVSSLLIGLYFPRRPSHGIKSYFVGGPEVVGHFCTAGVAGTANLSGRHWVAGLSWMAVDTAGFLIFIRLWKEKGVSRSTSPVITGQDSVKPAGGKARDRNEYGPKVSFMSTFFFISELDNNMARG